MGTQVIRVQHRMGTSTVGRKRCCGRFVWESNLLGPYPASRLERYRFLLVITDHFTKWRELIPVRKASAQAIANTLLENYISRYGAPISLISDKGPNLYQRCVCTVHDNPTRLGSDSHVETLYEGQRSSDSLRRSQPGKFKGSGKTSRSKHRNQKKPTTEPKRGIKRAIPSSVSFRNHKCRRPSQGPQLIAGPSHQQDSRQDKSPSVAIQYNKTRKTNTTKTRTNRAAERRTVRSNQTTAVRPCPYYLRSRVRQPEGFPEERRNFGIASIPQNNIRRRSLSMEALDGDPINRSE
ncbi:uncharacterized protein TNCV_4504461 [Trichonephila clavipes]|nr:uncharacterized protein TNCV_4504461 [Trichonephila clavipes]